MRKPFIAGNWKMNLERSSAIALAKAVCESVGARDDVDVGLFPPAVYLRDIVEAAQSSPVQVGAQNCCDQVGGAHTGEISVSMVQDVGSGLVLLGHSERRHVYGESDELINRKVHTALAQGLDVMLCLGETQEQREAGETEAVCGSQLQAGLAGVGVEDLQRVTLAYEPVWAIGTGRTARHDVVFCGCGGRLLGSQCVGWQGAGWTSNRQYSCGWSSLWPDPARELCGSTLLDRGDGVWWITRDPTA